MNQNLIVRIYHGVVDHFVIRLTEWAMLWPSFWIWFGLQNDPNMFNKSPAFVSMASWASEETWSAVFGLVMFARLIALAVNGTFREFKYSPHIRAGASLFGAIFWSIAAVGFLQAYFNGAAMSAFAMWSTPAVIEWMNIWRSGLDIGRQASRNENARLVNH